MRAAMLLLVPALLVSGCVDGVELGDGWDEGGEAPTSADGSRAAADEVLEAATAVAAEWNPRAIPILVSGSAERKAPNPFRATKAQAPLFADGTVDAWRFSFVVPATVALLTVDAAADGSAKRGKNVDLSRFTPDTGGYSEYFAMTPVDAAWLDTRALVRALRENETANAFMGGRADAVDYALAPDVRDLFVWRVSVRSHAGTMHAEVNPRDWSVWSVRVEGADGTTVDHSAERAVSVFPSGLSVREVQGHRDATDGDLRRLSVYVRMSDQDRPVRLDGLVVEYAAGAHEARLAAGDGGFTVKRLRGAEGEVLRAGDYVALEFDVPGGSLPPRTEVRLVLHAEAGAPVEVTVRTPATYGNALAVPLA